MSKLKEILESGRAPGFITGNHVDKTTVFHKAPKAIRELENTPRYKGGPNHSAKDIAKSWGMSVDFIKETWSKPVKTAMALVLGLFLCFSSYAGQIQAGGTLVDGQTVHASDLNNLVGNAVLLPGAISAQPLQTFGSSDYLLLYSPVNGALYRQTALNVLQSQYVFALLPNGNPIFTNADLFPFYSTSGTNTEAVTFSNLVSIIASNLNPSYVRYAVTNAGSGTNINYLPLWSGVYSGLNTNLQPYVLTWLPNGVPYYQPLSNFEASVGADVGTNYGVQYHYKWLWTPWLVFGTNYNGYTNAWAPTNFLITHLFMGTTNTATLTDTDQLPVSSQAQGTNTTATLQAVYEYLTNKNALPPYTVARAQFSGTHVTMTITNMSAVTGIITNIANAAAWTTPTPVSFQGAASQIPTVAQVQSNTVYYALFTNTSPNTGFQLYTNLANANARTNCILGNGVNSTASGTLLWLTNFTSFNCDVIQLSSTTSVRTGNYGLFFRTAAANNLYYITATLGNPDAVGGIAEIQTQNAYDLQTTNGCVVASKSFANGYQETATLHVLISPQ